MTLDRRAAELRSARCTPGQAASHGMWRRGTADSGGTVLMRRVAVLLGVVLAVVALVALCAVFDAVGLVAASEISGVIAAVVGMAALGLSVYGIVLARRPRPTGGITAGPQSQVMSGPVIVVTNIHIGEARDANLHDE